MRLTRTCLIAVAAVTVFGCHKADSTSPAVAANSSYDAVRNWAVAEATEETSLERESVAPVGDMIAGLEQRLADEPGDVSGWSLLAQSYAYTGQMDRAATAVDHAVRLGADRDELEQRVLLAHSGAR